MAKHLVSCVSCGRQFDANRGYAYDKESRRYTCPRCFKNEKKARADKLNAAGVPSGKSRTTALVLCVLIGYLGIHQFYAGKTGLGFLYLLTAGFCGIGWIVDIILIAKGRFKDADGVYLLK